MGYEKTLTHRSHAPPSSTPTPFNPVRDAEALTFENKEVLSRSGYSHKQGQKVILVLLLLAVVAIYSECFKGTIGETLRPVGGKKVYESGQEPFRLVLIITTSKEYDDGSRGTTKGASRLNEKLVPSLVSSISSLLDDGGRARGRRWTVDVHVIAAYSLAERSRLEVEENLRKAGASQVVVEDGALRTYVHSKTGEEKRATLGLAREHRFAIKQYLNTHDFFLAFEDDIVITRQHVENYIEKSKLLAQMSWDDSRPRIPGFLRVEVINETGKLWESKRLGDIDAMKTAKDFDASLCCGENATSVNVMGWEWNADSFDFVNLPEPIGETVALLPTVGVARAKDGFNADNPKLFAQQAGVMATREQILKFDEACTSRYLPPFDEKGDASMVNQGLEFHNVEFWSGGFHLFGRKCRVQRVVFFEKQGDFSHHLIYHQSNNKQTTVDEERFVRAEAILKFLRATAKKFADTKDYVVVS
jgi:hypothetical protein